MKRSIQLSDLYVNSVCDCAVLERRDLRKRKIFKLKDTVFLNVLMKLLLSLNGIRITCQWLKSFPLLPTGIIWNVINEAMYDVVWSIEIHTWKRPGWLNACKRPPRPVCAHCVKQKFETIQSHKYCIRPHVIAARLQMSDDNQRCRFLHVFDHVDATCEKFKVHKRTCKMNLACYSLARWNECFDSLESASTRG